jgi:hypothetical protein
MESRIPTWNEFVLWPFSTRARTFFKNSSITDVTQLTEKTAGDLVRFRGVGKTVLAELRLALAGYGLTLNGEKLPVEGSASELEDLLKERVALNARLREITSRIEQLRAVKKGKPRLPTVIMSKWLELQDPDAVAKTLGISKREVKSTVNASFQRRLKSGDLDKHEIFERWGILRNFDQVAEEFHVPQYLVRNVVRKMLKVRKP